MSGSRFEPETVVVAAPDDRGASQWTEDPRAERTDEEDPPGEEMDEPGYGHGV
jgi:hypothetical protein